MQFGALLPARHHVDVARLATESDRAGYDLIGVGDSPLALRETFTTLGWLSTLVSRARLATIVTNAVTRDASVLASAAGTLDELTDGRAILGIGTGDSAVAAIGCPPATLAVLERVVGRVRSLLEPDAEGGDAEAVVSWAKRAVPVFLSAEGPRTTRLAGRLADGVFLGGGLDEYSLSRSLKVLAEGAVEGGRRVTDIETWVFARVSVDSTRDAAIEQIRSGLAASANRSLRSKSQLAQLTPELREKLAALRRSYAVRDHLSAHDRSSNALLTHDDELAAFLADRFAIAGTPTQCADRVRALESLGVTRLCLTLASTDPMRTLRDWNTKVLPLLEADSAASVTAGGHETDRGDL